MSNTLVVLNIQEEIKHPKQKTWEHFKNVFI